MTHFTFFAWGLGPGPTGATRILTILLALVLIVLLPLIIFGGLRLWKKKTKIGASFYQLLTQSVIKKLYIHVPLFLVGVIVSISYGEGNPAFMLWYPGLYIILSSLFLVYNLFRYRRSLMLSVAQTLVCLLLIMTLFVIAAYYLYFAAWAVFVILYLW